MRADNFEEDIEQLQEIDGVVLPKKFEFYTPDVWNPSTTTITVPYYTTISTSSTSTAGVTTYGGGGGGGSGYGYINSSGGSGGSYMIKVDGTNWNYV